MTVSPTARWNRLDFMLMLFSTLDFVVIIGIFDDDINRILSSLARMFRPLRGAQRCLPVPIRGATRALFGTPFTAAATRSITCVCNLVSSYRMASQPTALRDSGPRTQSTHTHRHTHAQPDISGAGQASGCWSSRPGCGCSCGRSTTRSARSSTCTVPPPNPQVDLSAGVFCVWLVR